MRLFLITLITLPTLLLAQSCARQTFMDQCLSQSQKVLEACGNTDTCLCTQYKLQAACYDNCPQDTNSQQLKQTTLTVAGQRCNGTGNAPRPPPITTVNVALPNNTAKENPNSDFGKKSAGERMMVGTVGLATVVAGVAGVFAY